MTDDVLNSQGMTDMFPRVSARARTSSQHGAPPAYVAGRRPPNKRRARLATPGNIISAQLAQFDRRHWIGSAAAGATVLAVASFMLLGTVAGPKESASASTIGGSNVVSQDLPALPVTAGALSLTVGKNQTLADSLSSAGVTAKELSSITNGIGDIVPLSHLGRGTPYNLTYAQSPEGGTRIVSAMAIRVRMDLAIAVERHDGRLVAKPIPIKVDQVPLRYSGTVGAGGIALALESAGVPDAVIATYQKLLARHVETSSIRPTDRFDIVMERDIAATGDQMLGKMMYAGLYQANGIDTELSQWTMNGRLDWYDASEVQTPSGGIQRPVPGIVSSDFGERFHPILHYTRMHKGVDFKAGFGTPILAVQTGWVRLAGWNAGGYGNQVELTHGGGLSTTYSHMSSIIARDGQLVRQGQVIGYVGATGLATGPHLHFELHMNGEPINPASVEFSTGPRLSGRDLIGYQNRLNALLQVPISATPLIAANRGRNQNG